MEFLKTLFTIAVCMGTWSARAEIDLSDRNLTPSDRIIQAIHSALNQPNIIHRDSRGCIGSERFKLNLVNQALAAGPIVKGALFDLGIQTRNGNVSMTGSFVTGAFESYAVWVTLYQLDCSDKEVMSRVHVYLNGKAVGIAQMEIR